MSEEIFDIVVIGSGGVGKSCITIRFLKDEFSQDYDPTIEENYQKLVTVDEQTTMVSITDTAGQQHYKALRDQHLKDGQGFILVFALNDIRTFEEAKHLREQLFKVKDSTDVPVILCGNKCDLPKDQVQVKAQDLEYLMGEGVVYFETSAKDNINVSESFQEVVRQCRLHYKKDKKKRGSFLKKLFTRK
jgi:GTPase KRas protein